MMQTKDYRFEVKSVGDDGTFEGYLSVFNVVDLVNDVVEPGAFTKTIQDQKGVVPMLWQHDTKQPIGTLELSEDEYGLKVKGRLVMEVERAREAYALLKAGVIKGLSIGFEAIRKKLEKGIRHLKEIKLYEGSVVTFPALPVAQVTSVKSDEQKADFAAELENLQTYMMRRMMCDALMYSLDSIVYDYSGEMDAEAKVKASDDSIMQFHAAYTEFLPKLLALWGEKAATDFDVKAGRRISASTRTQIEEAITKLKALLDEDDSTSSEDDAAKSAPQTPPNNSPAPEGCQALHPWLAEFRDGWKSAFNQ